MRVGKEQPNHDRADDGPAAERREWAVLIAVALLVAALVYLVGFVFVLHPI